MFGKDDLVDNLSHDLDRARGKRDALASEVTTLTTQITEMEGRLSEAKSRRDRVRVLGEIEATKAQIKQATSEFVPLLGKLCEAIDRAAVVVPEARELNSFLLSVAAEVDSVVNPLLRELDQRADAVRVGQAAQGLPYSSNGAPIEPPSNNRVWLLRSLLLFSVWLSRIKELVKSQTTESPRGAAASHRRGARPKDPMIILCGRNRL